MAIVSNLFLCLSRGAAALCIAVALLACSAAQAPQPLMRERCLPVSAAAPIILQLAALRAGALRITVRERGISLASSLEADADNIGSASPVDRYGTMTLLAHVRHPRSYALRIISQDSADIAGMACVSADLLREEDRARLAAEGAFAGGGKATQARQWQRAFADYLFAARAFDSLDHERSAEARHAMAQLAYRRLARPRDGYALATRALVDFGSHADPGLRSALAELQATIIVESKAATPDTRRERALALLAAAAAAARRAPFGERELARLMTLRGFLEYATGSAPAAAKFFAHAVDACQALHDWECYARARMNGAEIGEESGENTRALQDYADALKALSPSVAPALAADIWDNLGRLQGYVGLFTLGEASQRHAMRLYAELDNCDGVRRSLSTLGSMLVRVGNVEDARRYASLATARDCQPLLALVSKDSGPDFAQLPAEADAAAPYAQERNTSAANFDCARAAPPAALSAEGEASVFRALLSMSEAAALEEQPASAQRCLMAAHAYASVPRRELRLANAMGSSFIDSGQPASAHDSFARALTIADRAKLAVTHENREVAYAGLAQAALLAHAQAEALSYSERALALASARADVSQVVKALQVLAMSLRATGERERAEQTLRLAVNLIEQVPIDDLDAETRATYLATQHRIFEELTDVLVAEAALSARDAARAQTWSAFAAAERGRARSLQYAIGQTLGNTAAGAAAHASATYQQLLARIAPMAAAAEGARQRSGALARLAALATRDDVAAPRYAEELPPQLTRLRATLVEYATGRDELFAFVIEGAENIHVLRLGSRRAISAAAAILAARLHDPEGAAEDIRRAAGALARLVLWPLTGYLTSERVIFIAADALHTIPFAVLPWSQDAESPLLLQRAEVSVAPSAFFMTHRPKPHAAAAAPHFELIGDPIFQPADWRIACAEVPARASHDSPMRTAADWSASLPRLPGSREEVLAIAQLARIARPLGTISVRLGCRATANGLREAVAAAPELLHIATHGYVDALRPRLSALALSRDPAASPDSGVFGLLDILATRSTSQLVVLSACDTSGGRLLAGEGVLGPAQAFLQSGAAAVIASYWRIDDLATTTFMRSFYKYLLRDHLPVGAALRQAQLKQATAGSAHNWAALALYGWPDSSL